MALPGHRFSKCWTLFTIRGCGLLPGLFAHLLSSAYTQKQTSSLWRKEDMNWASCILCELDRFLIIQPYTAWNKYAMSELSVTSLQSFHLLP
uniref:Putative secreted protein n=1 Tax=Ixodes ricinus TaxID=34613 RepID=A0A6B0UBD9_IXORI